MQVLVTRANGFLMAFNIPTMLTASLMKRQKEVGPAVENAAKKTCVNSTAAEMPCEQNPFDEQN